MQPCSHDIFRPDYTGGGIVNLMSSLCQGLGLGASSYKCLDAELGLSIDAVAAARHVILLVIDGLGDALLTRAGIHDLLDYQIARLSSVFPSTTASAIPTFLTGLAPQQHGLTGWHMWFEEIQHILAVLPLQVRGKKRQQSNELVNPDTLPSQLAFQPGIAVLLSSRCSFVSPREICESPLNRFYTADARLFPYKDLHEFFPAVVSAVKGYRPSAPGPHFVHAYLPDLDSLLHTEGPNSKAITPAIAVLGLGLQFLLKNLRATGSLLVVTADHGFIDAPESKRVELDLHPKLVQMLARPLCGERRVAYAYVRPECHADFSGYIERHLSHTCRLYESRDFLGEAWFGLGMPHPRLAQRIGDYVLLMRADWTIKDWMPTETRYQQRGVHAGSSAAEMLVPLLLARP